MTTKSPLAGGLVDGLQAGGCARAGASSSASTASSSAAGSRRADLDAACTSPSSAVGRTPISIVKVSGWPSAGQVAEVDVGVADGVDAGVVDRVDVPAAERAADGLVEDGLAADALDDDRRRDLALAEAGHAQVAPEPARGRLDRALAPPPAGTSASTRTRDSGSSVTVVFTAAAIAADDSVRR